MSKRVYILDPGHGGINPNTGEYVTPGKRSPRWSDGTILYEGVSNRNIAKKVGEKLKALGIEFAYTVTPTEWQDVSLATRVQRANALAAKKSAVFISIHSNAGPTSPSTANGFEVYTTPGETKSDEYATIFFNEFEKEFPELKARKDMSDGDPDREAHFYVIKGANCPAFLIESMFYTNEKECKLLMKPETEARIASVIVTTIQKIELL